MMDCSRVYSNVHAIIKRPLIFEAPCIVQLRLMPPKWRFRSPAIISASQTFSSFGKPSRYLDIRFQREILPTNSRRTGIAAWPYPIRRRPRSTAFILRS